MFYKFIFKISVIIIIMINNIKSEIEIENETDVINDDLYINKNFVHNNNYALHRILNEKSVKDILNDENETVNNYEDITILDESGHLRNLKFKSANKLNIPDKFKVLIDKKLSVDMNKVVDSGDNTQNGVMVKPDTPQRSFLRDWERKYFFKFK